MARIDIAKPYEVFLKAQVAAGMFRSITSAAEDAIRKQMVESEKLRIQSARYEVSLGEQDIKDGTIIDYNSSLISDLAKAAKENHSL